MPNEKGFHSHAEMVEIIEGKGAVRFNNKLYTRVEDLPSKAEIATIQGDDAAKEISKAEIAKKRAELDAQEALLGGAAGAVDTSGEGAQAAHANLTGKEPPPSLADAEHGTAGARQKAAEEAAAGSKSKSKEGEKEPANTGNTPPAK